MPAVSKKQRIAMSIAEHHPEQLYKRNKGMANMTQKQLHEFASTKETKLPVRKESTQAKFERMRAKQGAKRH